MNRIKNDHNESCSSNQIFLRENRFQKNLVNISPKKLTLNFENALFLSPEWKILAIVWKKNKDVGLISDQNWSSS